MRRIVMYSGGAGSWAAAKRVVERHGAGDVTLLFSDTKMEDEDLYRFLVQGAAAIGAPLLINAEGRDPWQVFFDVRYLGNSRADPCSRILKREIADNWLSVNCDPTDTIVYVGIDWTESHRYTRLRDLRASTGWRYEAPMCEQPYISKREVLGWLAEAKVKPPRLYEMGFSHNNCGGFCIKAGQAHFATLLDKMPERYAYHEAKEQEIRSFLDKDVSVLRDRSGGESKPLTLLKFRERIQSGGAHDDMEVGGCGCFSDVDQSELPL